MKKLKLIIFSGILCLCSVKALAVWPTKPEYDSVVNDFRQELGLNGFTLDTCSEFRWVDTVCCKQSGPDYNADKWYPVLLGKGDTLVGGYPGQSAYYTISAYYLTCNRDTANYWEGLQVKSSPRYGYRTRVTYYVVKNNSTIALIGKALNNPQYGKGGAWQFYVPNYSTMLDSVDIKNIIP
ncbi:MAG: hypothetical protein RSC04_02240 [Bacteroidales bacterium]